MITSMLSTYIKYMTCTPCCSIILLHCSNIIYLNIIEEKNLRWVIIQQLPPEMTKLLLYLIYFNGRNVVYFINYLFKSIFVSITLETVYFYYIWYLSIKIWGHFMFHVDIYIVLLCDKKMGFLKMNIKNICHIVFL